MDIAGADLVGGQTQTTTVDVSTDYSVQLYADADTDDTMDAGEELGNAYTFTEADLADESNVTNIALGAAGNGVFVDLDASALSGLGSGSSATTFIDFTVAAQSTYTAEIQDADGSNGLGTKVLSGSTATETIDLGEGITFAYDGTSLSAGDLYFSVKAGQDNFSATLTNTDTGNDIGSPIDFDAGDKIDFGNGLSIETVVDVEGGDEATFNVEDDTIDNSLSMQIGANMGQSFSVDISDMRAVALGISGKAADEAVTDNDGNTIANASFTTNESVTDGTNNDKVEFALDVSSHEKASAAVDVINNAIENVSAERSKLGAFQNRLEHTINNLGTSAENLTAAESRIRDVDMAKEMMEHTKNNILAQAAQAMLAQANQQPQGVLQLLR
ncbi:MAG: hypothetical protein FH758_04875 [Firmicutes bacterium]|nr:hypothetical protein [Bacillota bacterium]